MLYDELFGTTFSAFSANKNKARAAEAKRQHEMALDG